MRIVQIVFLLMFSLMLQGFKSDEMRGATQIGGTLTSFDLEDRRLVLGQTEYALSDHFYVVGKDNIVRSRGHLENGQKIEIWVTYPSGELPTIIKLQILSDIKIQS